MDKVIDFKKYSSINIGPKAKVKIINEIDNYEKYKIIGKANNLLVSNKPPLLAILGEEFDYIIQKGDKLIVGAATSSGKLLTYCKKNNIANLEFLAKLPGTVGGLTKMNAGLKQWEIFNYINNITTQDGVILKDEINYSYRYTDIKGVIFEVVFDIEYGYKIESQKEFVKMRDNQPNLPSAGSCFKNPKEHSAGYLIEKVGLKGFRVGSMAFSSIHANFLVNLGGGTFDEAIKLI
ncbi:MAG: UDP-N-acetylmuramate dehydrogenase, partial [Campylobacterota bacterium]|nr:UDP-N-acetylmuramate dehydrogenase [Campylobacterota bacterium]